MPHATKLHGPAQAVLESLLIEPISDLLQGMAFIIALIGFQDERCGQRVNFKALFIVNDITYRACTTCGFGLQRIVCHSPNDFLG